MKLEPLREPTLWIREVESPLTIHSRAWLFLDYGPNGDLMNLRWAIGARPDIESFEMFSPCAMYAPTNERAIGLLATEAELAKEAIAQIRAACREEGLTFTAPSAEDGATPNNS